MKIQKNQIEPLFEALNYPIKKFTQARVRDRFIKSLQEEHKIFSEERQSIIKKYADKGKDKEVLITDGSYTFKPGALEKAEKELSILLKEDVTLNTDITIGQVKELVENSTVEFKPGSTETLYSMFEEVTPKKKK